MLGKWLAFIFGALLFLQSTGCAEDKDFRIAMLYRSNSSFVNELSAFKEVEDWSLTGFDIKDQESLADKLGEFDLVVIGSLANRDRRIDFSTQNGKWKNYVSSGGCLLLIDANYTEALDSILGGFSGDLKISFQEGCSQYSKSIATPPPARFSGKSSLVHIPNNLQKAFTNKHTWAHLTGMDRKWNVPVKCPDGHGTFAWRNFGKGQIFVTSWGGLNSPEGQRMLHAMAENVIAFVQCRRVGIELENFSATPALVGSGKISFSFSRTGHAGKTFPYKLLIKNNDEILCEETGKATSAKTVTASYNVKTAGSLSIYLTLGSERTATICSVNSVPEPFRLIRKVFYPASAKAVPFMCSLSPITLADKDSRYILSVDGQSVEIPAPLGEKLEFPTKGLKHGEHVSSICVKNKAGKILFTSAKEKFSIQDKNPQIHVDANGKINRNGTLIFPVGIYHVIPREGISNQRDFLDYASRSGFDFVHVSGQLRENLPAFLDYAEKKNVSVLAEHINARVIDKFKKHPAIFGWNVGDEPEVNNRSVNYMLDQYTEFKHVDPEHPLYTVFASIRSVRPYSGAADIVAHDCYPIPDRPICQVYSNLRHVVANLGPGSAPFAVIQVQGYAPGEHFGPKRVPTPKEVRNMTCQALLSGVSGIVFYTYKDTYGGVGFRLPEHPKLMKEVGNLPAFIKKIEPYLLNGSLTHLDKSENLLAGTWQLETGKEKLLIAVNCRSSAATMTLNIQNKQTEVILGKKENLRAGPTNLKIKLAPREAIAAILK